MFCNNCGAQNDDNAFKCISCGAVLARPPVVSTSGRGPAESPLVWAILVTLFCCLPGGIVAIIYAAQVNTRNAEGNYDAAHVAASNARTWCWVSFGIGLLATVGWLAVSILGAAAGGLQP